MASQVTVQSAKKVAFDAPYTGATFQVLAEDIFGQDGYISGGAVSDTGGNITIEPVKLVQRGIIAETTANAVLTSPSVSDPWYVLAAILDDDPASGVVLSVTTDREVASSGLVVAYRSNGFWHTIKGIDVSSAALSSVKPGVVEGFSIRQTVTAGLVDGYILGNGSFVDIDGNLQVLRGPDGDGDLETLVPFAPGDEYARNDYIVIRQLPGLRPTIEQIVGGSYPTEQLWGFRDDDPTVTQAIGVRAISYFALRGSLEKGNAPVSNWKAWGEQNNLRSEGGDGGAGYARLTSYTGSSQIDNLNVVGQRASDSAIIIVFTEGDDLKMMSIAGQTGAAVDAPVTIHSGTSARTRVFAVMDPSEKVHVVFEHDPGTKKQVFYARLNTVIATFAVAEVGPVIANETDSGNTDTYPTIGVDSKGTVHIAYVSGGGANEFGSLRYIVIDSVGTVLSKTTLTDYGLDVDPDDLIPIAAATFDNVRQTSLVVTPHDEVYVATIGTLNGDGQPSDVMLFSPSFKARLGFDVIGLIRFVDKPVKLVTMTAGEQGDLWLHWLRERNADSLVDEIRGCVVDAVFAPDGFVGPSICGRGSEIQSQGSSIPFDPFAGTGETPNDAITNRTLAADTLDYPLRGYRGPVGNLILTHLETRVSDSFTDVFIAKVTPFFYRSPRPHPRDIYLAAHPNVPGESSSYNLDERWHFIEKCRFSRTPRFPIIVGEEGDFPSLNGLADAADFLAKKGGLIVVMPGVHHHSRSIRLQSSVQVRGVGRPHIEKPKHNDAANNTIVCGSMMGDLTITAIVETSFPGTAKITLGEPIDEFVKPGDMILTGVAANSTLARVQVIQRIVQRTPVGIVEIAYGNISGSSDEAVIYSAGINIENISFEMYGSWGIVAFKCYQFRLRDISSTSDGGGFQTKTIYLKNCRSSILDNVELLSDADREIRLEDGFANKVLNTVFGNPFDGFGGGAKLKILATEEYPSIINCVDTTSTTTSVDIDSGRSTPVAISGSPRIEQRHIQTLTDGVNISIDVRLNKKNQVTLGGNRTLDNPPADSYGIGDVWTLLVIQDVTGGRTLAFGSEYDFGDEGAPNFSGNTGSQKDLIRFEAINTDQIACTTRTGFLA